jgi:hypothetical protein
MSAGGALGPRAGEKRSGKHGGPLGKHGMAQAGYAGNGPNGSGADPPEFRKLLFRNHDNERQALTRLSPGPQVKRHPA